MRKLPINFVKNGFTYIQLLRKENVALYSIAFVKEPHIVVGYETIKIRISPKRIFPNGREIPEMESYPSPESFGEFGWSYNTKEGAMNKFNELTGNPERFEVKDPNKEYM